MTRWIFLWAILASLLTACQKDDVPSTRATDQIALLRVDYRSSIFEGAREWTFPTHATLNFDMSYRQAWDLMDGNFTVYYREENVKLFDGNSMWVGTGELVYPTTFSPAASYPTTSSDAARPPFKQLQTGAAPAIDSEKEQELWNAIKDLNLVQHYFANHPEGKVYFFLYTPSVGLGENPDDWDWMIFLKG